MYSYEDRMKAMGLRKGKNNAQSIFDVYKFPIDIHIRNLLGPVPPRPLCPVFDKVFEFLEEQKVIADLVTNDGLLLIALDGTCFFSSEQIQY